MVRFRSKGNLIFSKVVIAKYKLAWRGRVAKWCRTCLELAGRDRDSGSRREAVDHRMWDIVDEKSCIPVDILIDVRFTVTLLRWTEQKINKEINKTDNIRNRKKEFQSPRRKDAWNSFRVQEGKTRETVSESTKERRTIRIKTTCINNNDNNKTRRITTRMIIRRRKSRKKEY